MKHRPDFSVNLNEETYDLLQKVKRDLFTKLGFEPSNGQVVRHLIALYLGEPTCH